MEIYDILRSGSTTFAHNDTNIFIQFSLINYLLPKLFIQLNNIIKFIEIGMNGDFLGRIDNYEHFNLMTYFKHGTTYRIQLKSLDIKKILTIKFVLDKIPNLINIQTIKCNDMFDSEDNLISEIKYLGRHMKQMKHIRLSIGKCTAIIIPQNQKMINISIKLYDFDKIVDQYKHNSSAVICNSSLIIRTLKHNQIKIINQIISNNIQHCYITIEPKNKIKKMMILVEYQLTRL
jgi:ribosomal protein L25 (general stress protein Ctc)